MAEGQKGKLIPKKKKNVSKKLKDIVQNINKIKLK